MEHAVYVLCGLAALACSVLLMRGYMRKRVPLLLWCGLFFFALAIENAILFVDIAVVPHIDLSVFRRCVALVGVSALLYGLICETK